LREFVELVPFSMTLLASHGCTPHKLLEDHVWFEDRWMVASLCDE
jgi:hypothetical protein